MLGSQRLIGIRSERQKVGKPSRPGTDSESLQRFVATQQILVDRY